MYILQLKEDTLEYHRNEIRAYRQRESDMKMKLNNFHSISCYDLEAIGYGKEWKEKALRWILQRHIMLHDSSKTIHIQRSHSSMSSSAIVVQQSTDSRLLLD